MPLPAGTRIGPYEIQALIGSGGMGEVYRARDPRLDRTVAIKRLSVPHDDRFQAEARAIAALNHPHICQIYDVGPDYLVLEYLEGSSPVGPIPVEQALTLSAQLADALEAAHRHGILHRDLKPANVIVTSRGVAKLLDFGVAKRVATAPDVTQTVAGLVVGTAAYMSPEQASGRAVDARSDVFSLGAMMYELIAGRRPFGGDTTMAVAAAILRDDPPPLVAPAAVVDVISRCLAKSPAARYQSMADVAAAIATARQGGPAPETASIAVLPFANLSGDKENEYFADGLAEEIIHALSHVPGLKVIARTSAFAFKGRHEDVRQIAAVLGVAHVLEGSVRRSGDRIRVTAQLVAARDGTQVWSERYNRSMADVFEMQDEIARAITGALEGRIAMPSVVRPPMPSVAAYDALLRGRHHLFTFTPEAWRRARESFDQAVALDPTYAAPHAELAMGYFISGMHGLQPLPDVVPVVRTKVQRAISLDPSDPLPRVLLGAVALVQDYDWPAAEQQFALAFKAPRISAEAHWIYASLYLCTLGRFDESAERMARAVDLDPLNASWRAVWSAHLQCANHLDRAIEEAKKAVDLAADYAIPRMILGEAYLHAGRLAEAVETLEQAHRLGPWSAMTTGIFAAALVLTGQAERAAALVASISTMSQQEWGRVWYHVHVAEPDAAAEWYDRMIDVRDPFALVYASAPFMRPLHDHPRWPALARRMNLPVDSRRGSH